MKTLAGFVSIAYIENSCIYIPMEKGMYHSIARLCPIGTWGRFWRWLARRPTPAYLLRKDPIAPRSYFQAYYAPRKRWLDVYPVQVDTFSRIWKSVESGDLGHVKAIYLHHAHVSTTTPLFAVRV